MQIDLLVMCETSGIVREAFRSRGLNAFSVDILESDDDSINHFVGDVYEALDFFEPRMIIAHPPCTALCVAGNHVYAKGKPKHHERQEAVKWTEDLWFACLARAEKVCFENPVGVLFTQSRLPKPQYVQPYEFGEDASKKTGLFLHNLPRLEGTKRIQGRIVNGKERWSNQTDSGQNKLGPSEDRWKLRSKTYLGIAEAMAEQWT